MINLRYLPFERYLSNRCQAILTNSVGVKRELVQRARVKPEKIRVIYNHLDTRHFHPPSADERRMAQAKWRVSDHDLVFVLPGRVGIQKNQVALLWAMLKLAAQKRLPHNLVLLLVGRKRDRFTSWLVDRLSSRPAIRRHVRFLDAQQDMLSVYWASDVVVMPSLFEGLSNAALEACSCGLPAIFSHAVNLDGLIVDGQMGIEVPTWSIAKLADAIVTMASHSTEHRVQMGQLARQHVAQKFSPNPTFAIDQVVDVYRECLDRQNTPTTVHHSEPIHV